MIDPECLEETGENLEKIDPENPDFALGVLLVCLCCCRRAVLLVLSAPGDLSKSFGESLRPESPFKSRLGRAPDTSLETLFDGWRSSSKSRTEGTTSPSTGACPEVASSNPLTEACDGPRSKETVCLICEYLESIDYGNIQLENRSRVLWQACGIFMQIPTWFLKAYLLTSAFSSLSPSPKCLKFYIVLKNMSQS